MVYERTGASPTERALLKQLEGITGFDKRLVVCEAGTTEKGNYKGKTFRGCDMAFHMEKSSFTGCKFEMCRFVGCDLKVVKFSDCDFEKCHFMHVIFKDCIFINCRFSRNSASPEHCEIVGTEISPDEFLNGITTNTEFLPEHITSEYQYHRLTRSKAHLARKLYKSNEIGGNIEYFFQAQKYYIIFGLLSDIEEHRYLRDTKNKDGAAIKNRFFLPRSSLLRMEYGLTVFSGWLVDWGRSLMRVLVLTAVVIAVFAVLYHYLDHISFQSSLIRSFEVTSVAGYTIHREASQSGWMQWLKVFNLVFGLYTYALVVPVIIRRVLR